VDGVGYALVGWFDGLMG